VAVEVAGDARISDAWAAGRAVAGFVQQQPRLEGYKPVAVFTWMASVSQTAWRALARGRHLTLMNVNVGA
jgi:hypothetical protein